MVRPIDLQDNLSKAPLAAREQQIQQANSELGQRHLARELNDRHVLDQERAVPAEETDTAENRIDDDGGNQGRSRQQDRHTGDSESRRESRGDESKSEFSHLIDVVA